MQVIIIIIFLIAQSPTSTASEMDKVQFQHQVNEIVEDILKS